MKASLTIAAIGLFLTLIGCTTYTWPDGTQQTVLGVPAQAENKSHEERQAEPIIYRIPGQVFPGSRQSEDE
ncbi:hypothetical protein M8006_12695 [Halomonas sp. ATCHA]|uniref:Uncharacterized protein n=1 Tax=Halomonas llamarensis TaxID=2945104 RepID=A0ABT0SSM1_9GAMM|nr:hypothetical protein [Halomonas llamarensis]